ncbi:MAG: DUF4349 domain-containing protein [Longimicrobiales bacterium]|nr:DUF4349 domain-containing protein [Longimicrobiales bacterium]
MTEFSSVAPDRAAFTGWAARIVALLALSLSGCRPGDLGFEIEEMRSAPDAIAAGEVVPDIEMLPPSPSPSRARQVAPPQSRLIRSGSARVEVSDVEVADAEARRIGDALGGYVASSDFREGEEGARRASLVLRIPADSLDLLVESLPELGKLLSVSISTEDVSREYVDIETRLAVQEETVQRLRELAARGGSLADLIAAERELGRAVGELESFKGRIRYFDQRIAESDFRLSLEEPGAVADPGAFHPVIVAFRRSVEVFANSLAWIVYAVTFALPWVVLALAAVLVIRRRWATRRERRAAEASP